jgi:catechol 2,3-dioxygenase-like lactoylglutathione lyase family enzyme
MSSMFEIRDLNHVNLVVKDLASAKSFYCETLGMEDLPRPADLQVRGAWLHSQSAEIHLIVEAYATHAPGDLSYAISKQPGIDIGSSRHFSLVINNTQALVQRLAAHGIEIAFGPVTRFGGLVQTYCYDPDGHLVEFTQLPA